MRLLRARARLRGERAAPRRATGSGPTATAPSPGGVQALGTVRVRYAPSPTGELHLGGLRTALFNYLLAKQQPAESQSRFLLRIEDTDQSRVVAGAAERLARTLDWAGIPFDEGPGREPRAGESYVQSQRLPLYTEHADVLLKKGAAYRCFCSEQRLEELRVAQQRRGAATMYDRACAGLSDSDVRRRMERREAHVVRFRVPEGATHVRDELRGRLVFQNQTIDDQVLFKSDGFPTYHLASVVDDHAMHISHVIRGEEWLPSLPKHVLLYRAFGWSPPRFLHLPLLLNSDRHKLSKRHGDVSVASFRDRGFIPGALVNFVALLGWNPGDEQEFFTLEQLVARFSLDRLQKQNAVVDMRRLEWLNGLHMRHLAAHDMPRLLSHLQPALETQLPEALVPQQRERLALAVGVVVERATTLHQLAQLVSCFFRDPAWLAPEVAEFRQQAWEQQPGEGAAVLRAFLELAESLAEAEFSRPDQVNALLGTVAQRVSLAPKRVLAPLRFALTGAGVGAGLPKSAAAIGKAMCVARVRRFLERFAA